MLTRILYALLRFRSDRASKAQTATGGGGRASPSLHDNISCSVPHLHAQLCNPAATCTLPMQVTLALSGFVLLPQLRAAVQAASPAAHACLTAVLGCAAVATLLPLSILLATSYVCSAAFVSLICPMWLVRVGKFKAQINGPWDEAVPKLSRDVSLRAASPRKGALGSATAAATVLLAGCVHTQARLIQAANSG